MNQSKLESLEETVINVATGYCVSLVIQLIFFPMFGLKITFLGNLGLTAIFTVSSVIRSYYIRRIYNKHRGFFTRVYLNWRRSER